MNSKRTGFDSPLSRDADLLCEKWKVSAPRLSFHDMLADISTFIALSSKEGAQTFSDYWNATLSKGSSVGQQRRAAGQ